MSLLPTFTIEENPKFYLELDDNKDVYIKYVFLFIYVLKYMHKICILYSYLYIIFSILAIYQNSLMDSRLSTPGLDSYQLCYVKY